MHFSKMHFLSLLLIVSLATSPTKATIYECENGERYTELVVEMPRGRQSKLSPPSPLPLFKKYIYTVSYTMFQ